MLLDNAWGVLMELTNENTIGENMFRHLMHELRPSYDEAKIDLFFIILDYSKEENELSDRISRLYRYH